MPLVCLHHPDRHATTSCSHCSKPLCTDCIIRHGRDVFCSPECLRASHVDSREGLKTEGILHPSPLRLALCAAIAAACALAIAALLL